MRGIYMTSKSRLNTAMRLGIPDRVPVMCQLSIGHYFLQAGIDPLEIWFTSEGFAAALHTLQQRYRFDGILVNLPGRDPQWQRHLLAVEKHAGETRMRWRNGNYTVVPDDDNPHYYQADGSRYFPEFDDIDPEQLYYIEPWDLTDITYPYTWGFEEAPRPFDDFFPDYHLDPLKRVLEICGDTVSVHTEVFSPWSQFMDLLNYENALIAILDDPEKVKACLERLTAGAADLARRQAAAGADALLISSAFAGAGLISREHYRQFVLPYEREIVQAVQRDYDVPVYTHTCGSIGDRLDLMLETGTNGIDTLDPPPLGTVDLEEAKRFLNGKAFIKGNIDPVNTLLNGDPESIRKDVQWRLAVGSPGGGYILSTACSVAPHTPGAHILLLAEMAEANAEVGMRSAEGKIRGA